MPFFCDDMAPLAEHVREALLIGGQACELFPSVKQAPELFEAGHWAVETGYGLGTHGSVQVFVLTTMPGVTPNIWYWWFARREGVNAKMPPPKLARLLKFPLLNGLVKKKILTALRLDQCRVAAGGAAPMPAELMRWYAALGLNLIELFGMTENGCTHSTDMKNPLPGSVGQVLNGVQCRLDPESNEVRVLSQGLMLGYFQEP